MIQNKIVIHHLDGRLEKGVTTDFFPNKETFHITQTAPGSKPAEVRVSDLKAIFFVKDFGGNPNYNNKK